MITVAELRPDRTTRLAPELADLPTILLHPVHAPGHVAWPHGARTLAYRVGQSSKLDSQNRKGILTRRVRSQLWGAQGAT